MKEIEGVVVPPPIPETPDTLLLVAEGLLHRYFYTRDQSRPSPIALTLLVGVIVTHLQTDAVAGRPLPRVEFERLLELWKNECQSMGTGSTTGDPTVLWQRACAEQRALVSTITIPGIQAAPSLQQVWVDLQVEACPSRSVSDFNRQSTKSEKYWGLEVLSGLKCSVILGSAGFGKTTLGKMGVLRCVERDRAALFLRCRNLADCTSGCPSLVAQVAQVLSNHTDTAVAVQDLVEFPPSLVVFDGLDEAGNSRVELAERIQEFSRTLPTTRVAVLSRPNGFDPAFFSDWPQFRLLRMSKQTAINQASGILDAALAYRTASERSQQIEEFLKTVEDRGLFEPDRLRPLYVIYLISLHLQGHPIHESRLMNLEALLGMLRISPRLGRDETISMGETEARNLIEALAWTSIVEGKTRRRYLVECTARELIRTGQYSERGPLLRVLGRCIDFWSQRGLIDQSFDRGIESLNWLHFELAEFLAACHLDSLPEENQDQLIANLSERPDWGPVLSLLAGRDSTGRCLARLLASVQTEGVTKKVTEVLTEALREGGNKHSEVLRSSQAVLLEAVSSTDVDASTRGTELLQSLAKPISHSLHTRLKELQQAPLSHVRLGAQLLALDLAPEAIDEHQLNRTLNEHEELRHGQGRFEKNEAGGINISGPSVGHKIRTEVVVQALRHRLNTGGENDPVDCFRQLLEWEHTPQPLLRRLREIGKEAPHRNRLESVLASSREPVKDSAKWIWSHFAQQVQAATRLMGLLSEVVGPFEGTITGFELDPTSFVAIETGRLISPLTGLGAQSDFIQTPEWTDEQRELAVFLFGNLMRMLDIDKAEVRREIKVFAGLRLLYGQQETVLQDPIANLPLEADWANFDQVGVDAGRLVSALSHPADIISGAAAHLLEFHPTTAEVGDQARILLRTGTTRTRWLVGLLANQFWPNHGDEEIMTVLEARPRGRLSMLLRVAAQRGLLEGREGTNLLVEYIRSAPSVTARSAACLLEQSQTNLDDSQLAELEDALDYWRDHEDPIAQVSSTFQRIPPTPRSDLIKILARHRRLSLAQYIGLLEDPRVKSVSRTSFMELLQSGYFDEREVLNGIQSGRIATWVLGKILELPFERLLPVLDELRALRRIKDPTLQRAVSQMVDTLVSEHGKMD
jgi:hypothetical protein